MYLLLFCNITKIMSQGLHLVEEFLKSVDRVKHAYKQMILKVIRESGVDITYEMLEVMRVLWSGDGANQQVLANATLKDKVSLTYLIDHLTKRNWVIRVAGKEDRRSKLIYLTEEGKSLELIFKPHMESINLSVSNQVPPEEMKAAIHLLDKVSNEWT